MPMAINTREEYEKVANVSWFAQDLPIDELTFVCTLNTSTGTRNSDSLQVPLRLAVLTDVSTVLYRY